MEVSSSNTVVDVISSPVANSTAIQMNIAATNQLSDILKPWSLVIIVKKNIVIPKATKNRNNVRSMVIYTP